MYQLPGSNPSQFYGPTNPTTLAFMHLLTVPYGHPATEDTALCSFTLRCSTARRRIHNFANQLSNKKLSSTSHYIVWSYPLPMPICAWGLGLEQLLWIYVHRTFPHWGISLTLRRYSRRESTNHLWSSGTLLRHDWVYWYLPVSSYRMPLGIAPSEKL